MTKRIDVTVFSVNYAEKPCGEASDQPARVMPNGKAGVCYKAWVYPVHRVNGNDQSLRIFLDDQTRSGKKTCPIAPDNKALDFIDDVNIDSKGGYVITSDLDWHERNLDRLVNNPINIGAIITCPICRTPLTVKYAPAHYILHLTKLDKEKFKKLIGENLNKAAEFVQRKSQSLGEISGIPITKPTKKQLLNDLKNAGKGILPDAKAAPSNVRKIDRNKRRK